ncbi:MAG: CubicO group peptidase (beta-lactamase class C family) [Saprospiraceae bacterium]|jgi:CubicO group peptidase (beta-lactamase class C family)
MKNKFSHSIRLLIAIGLLFQPLLSNAQKKNNPLKGFDKFVESALKDWNVPGAGIAIVKDGEVILVKGYGYADVAKKRKADKKTLFAIGSSSKAFTAASVMQLVDEKKLDLNKSVISYLPNFKLYDDYATKNITPRDLLSHRSGLPRHDLVWYGSKDSREGLYNRLRYLEPTAELRETWQYQNLMYMTAGYLVGQIEKESWEETVKRKIFTPLGMNATNFSVEDSKKVKNHALPYNEKEGQLEKIDFRNIDAIGPAGSINSNAEDMAKWLQLLLNEGKFDGKEILSAGSLKEMYKPQMVMPGEINYDEIYYSSYGLAWMLTSYRGKLRVEHGGNIDGFTTSVCFMPRDGIGVVVMTNMNGTALNSAIRNDVIDRLLGGETKDWNGILLEKRREILEASKVETETEDIIQRKGTRPSFDLKEYTGKYEHKGYGIIEIQEKDGNLVGLMNSEEVDFEHYHFDIFKLGAAVGELKIQFHMNTNADITELSAPLEPSLGKPIIFNKLPMEMDVSEANLKIYEGKYTFAAAKQSATVETKNGVLMITIPGQPTYSLVPYKEHHFNLEILEGYSVKFTIEEEKSVKATFIQPNGNFTFEREE